MRLSDWRLEAEAVGRLHVAASKVARRPSLVLDLGVIGPSDEAAVKWKTSCVSASPPVGHTERFLNRRRGKVPG